MKYLFIILGLLFLTGCTTTLDVKCPTCTCPTQTVTSSAKDYVQLDFIDVGQGDSTLIKSGDTEMLIDCGKTTAGLDVVQYLKNKGVTTLEYLVMTHPDADHIGGCYDVLTKFPVSMVITNGQSADTIAWKDVVNAMSSIPQTVGKIGMKYNIGPSEVTILQANNGAADTNINSIVMKLVYGQESALLTSDCDKECETLLISKDLNATILKVPHHGTSFGSSIVFLEKVNPQVGVISVGDNSYGHPAPGTLDRLSQQGVLVYRTDVKGNVEIKLHSNSYEVN